MTTNDFCYWLHGWSELNGAAAPTPEQWRIINDHLDLVFNKVTPDRSINSFPNVPFLTGYDDTGYSGVPYASGQLPFRNTGDPFLNRDSLGHVIANSC